MNTHADKTQENKSQSVANEVAQKQSISESTFQFVDNRPEAVAQRKLQEFANNSPQAKRAAQLQAMVDKHTAQQRQPLQKKENNTGLPDNLKTGIENLSGMSLDDVKVHRNSDKPAQLQAHAYAQGTDIHLGPGQEKHLPHEAWHVVQQKQGRVKPTMQMKGKVKINDDDGLEKEADVMGQKSLNLSSSNSHQFFKKSAIQKNVVQLQSDAVVQRMKIRFTDIDDFIINLPQKASESFKNAIWSEVSMGVKVNQTESDVSKFASLLSAYGDNETVDLKYLDHFRWQGRWGPIKYAHTGRPKVEETEPSKAEPSMKTTDESLWRPPVAKPVVDEHAGEASSDLSPMGKALGRAKLAKPSEPNHKSGAEIADEIAPLVSSFVNTTLYDRMIFVEQFIDHYTILSTEKEVTPEQAFLTFAPSSSMALTKGGAHCSGQAGALISQIQGLSLNCHLIPSVLQDGMGVIDGPPFGHAAVAVPFIETGKFGVVLADPGFNLSIPIVLKVGEPFTHKAGLYTWMFILGSNYEVQAKSVSKHGEALAAYQTDVALTNPDEAIAKPLAAVDTSLSIVKRGKYGQVLASIVTDLSKQEIRLRAGQLSQKYSFEEAILKLTAKELISDPLAKLLESDKVTLEGRIHKILSSTGILARLRSNVHDERNK